MHKNNAMAVVEASNTNNPNGSSEDIRLDLSNPQTLYELAVEPDELLGRPGAKLLADMKGQAIGAGFKEFCYRDPMRPGIIWLVNVATDNGMLTPSRARLDYCRAVAETVFPEFIAALERKIKALAESGASGRSMDDVVMAEIPPITRGPSGMELATALEYMVFTYPAMVRAWAALIFVYDQLLGLKEGAESARSHCMAMCAYPQIVSYFLGERPAAEA